MVLTLMCETRAGRALAASSSRPAEWRRRSNRCDRNQLAQKRSEFNRDAARQAHRVHPQQKESDMYHRERAEGTGFTMGLMAGAVVGAGVALLFAPKAGSELRENLGESMGTLREAVTRHVRDLADRAGVDLDNLQASVDRATEAAESTANEMVNSAAERARGMSSQSNMPA
jgi:gas vesicle protein